MRPEQIDKSGFVMLLVLIVMASLSAILGSLVVALTADLRQLAVRNNESRALWLAEAGIEKAIWNLQTPVSSGGQGDTWTTAGTSESLGDGSYTLVVEPWNYALASNGASASSPEFDQPAANAIDGNSATYWESGMVPSPGQPQYLIIQLPYPITVNKFTFVADGDGSRPRDYVWAVSSDNSSYTTVVTGNEVSHNPAGVTDEFPAQSNVNYVRLTVTKDGQGSPNRVRINSVDIVGRKITSTGTVNSISRVLAQTAVADDATETSFDQIGWNEV